MLEPEVFAFLKSLRENNHREWFHEHKPDHDHAKKCVQTLSNNLFEKLNVANQLDGHKVFRIYRDVRFSKNKTPYKTHFGIAFHRTKPKFRGGYYLHLEPGNSFVASGFWGPNKDDLFRIRKEIEMDHEYFEKMAAEKKLIQEWGSMQGDQLKTAPKGFDKDHPGISNLRFKQFIFHQKITDSLIHESDLSKYLEKKFNAVRPFLNFMGDVLTTDLNGESII